MAASEQRKAPGPSLETGMKDFVTLDEVAVRLFKIQRMMEDQIPGHAEFAAFTLPAGGQFVFDDDVAAEYSVRGPWMAINVSNDGTANLQYAVNDGVTKDTILPNETREVNMKAKNRVYQLVFYPTVATPIRLAFIR